jgi:hypothetical protein
MAYNLSDLSSVYDSADRRAAELLNGLSEEQANWQPQPGRSWSILQCFDHLVRTNKAFSDRLAPALEKAPPAETADREIVVGWLARKLLESTEPPPKKKFKSPKPTVPPVTLSAGVVLPAFHGSNDRLRTLVKEAQRHDSNRAKFTHPFVPFMRLTVAFGLLLMATHERRHLWQAEQVRGAAGFPGSATAAR